jgi:hypothetical protein
LPSPDTDLKPNDQRLFEALGEIVRACQSHRPPLPALSSLVVRRTEDGSLGTPGPGYFALVFPGVREETARLQMWGEEVKRVVACPYPKELAQPEARRPKVPPNPLGWLHEPTVIAAIIGLLGTLVTVVASIWVASRHDQAPQQPQPDRTEANIVQKSDEPPRPGPPASPVIKGEPQKLTLDEILDVLGRHRQRATFGAVAGILRREPGTLFKSYTRAPRTAWVVSKATGLTTGTEADEYPPGLLQNERVIDTPEELRLWLRTHH